MGTKLTLLEIGAVGVVGYIAVSKLTGWDPIGATGKGITDWFSGIWSGIFGGGTKSFQWITSKDSAKQGETFSIYAFGMPPNQQFIYGWQEIGAIATLSASDKGEWFSPDILVTANPGTYHIYLDLTPFGGDKSSRVFTVLPGGTVPLASGGLNT